MPRDHVRHHRARTPAAEQQAAAATAIAAAGMAANKPERHLKLPGFLGGATAKSRLLKMAHKEIDWNKLMYDNKDNARMLLYGTCFLLLSMVSYIAMILTWYFLYCDSFNGSLVIFVLLLTGGAIMSLFSKQRVTGVDRPWLAWAGFFFAVGALIGVWVGFYLYYKHLIFYWKYESMRTYTNIAASQPSYAFEDANMILWTEDTRIDATRSVGYKSKWDGQVYCVAPIVDGGMKGQSVINFWAVGDNCCSARADFECMDAADSTTRSSLVVLEPEDIVRPWMKWAVRDAAYPKYERALSLHEATYNTKAAETVKLMLWTKDPIALKNQFRWGADRACVKWTFIFAPVLLIFACWVAAKYVILPWRLEESAKMDFQPAHGSF